MKVFFFFLIHGLFSLKEGVEIKEDPDSLFVCNKNFISSVEVGFIVYFSFSFEFLSKAYI